MIHDPNMGGGNPPQQPVEKGNHGVGSNICTALYTGLACGWCLSFLCF